VKDCRRGCGAIGAFGGDPNVRLLPEEASNPLPRQRLVVGNDHPNRFGQATALWAGAYESGIRSVMVISSWLRETPSLAALP
jgi:hypothetical protein